MIRIYCRRQVNDLTGEYLSVYATYAASASRSTRQVKASDSFLYDSHCLNNTSTPSSCINIFSIQSLIILKVTNFKLPVELDPH